MAKAKEEDEKKAVRSKKKEPNAKSAKEVESPEDVLKSKKDEAKAAKKAGPKASRAKQEAEEPAKAEKPEKSEEPVKVKGPSLKPARPRIERRGKKYREAYKQLDKAKEYALDELVELLPRTSFVKFTPSVEIHINLGVDPKQADQMVRATVVLPHGTGKSQRVGVVASGDDQTKAKSAGADVVGEDDLLEKIGKGQFDFDILVATPAMMPKLGQHAKTLGPKGLMP